MVSGSTDSQIIVWSLNIIDYTFNKIILNGHTGSIVSLSVLQTNEKTYILSSSIDNTVKLWSKLNVYLELF